MKGPVSGALFQFRVVSRGSLADRSRASGRGQRFATCQNQDEAVEGGRLARQPERIPKSLETVRGLEGCS